MKRLRSRRLFLGSCLLGFATFFGFVIWRCLSVDESVLRHTIRMKPGQEGPRTEAVVISDDNRGKVLATSEDVAGLLALGERAIPALIRQMTNDQPRFPIRSWLAEPAAKIGLQIDRPPHVREIQAAAACGLFVLGTNAAPAVPALGAILTTSTNRIATLLAFRCLVEQGEVAIPFFVEAIRSTNTDVQRLGLSGLGRFPVSSRRHIGVVLEMAQNSRANALEDIRSQAYRLVGELGGEPVRVVLAAIETSRAENLPAAAAAAFTLGRYSRRAREGGLEIAGWSEEERRWVMGKQNEIQAALSGLHERVLSKGSGTFSELVVREIENAKKEAEAKRYDPAPN